MSFCPHCHSGVDPVLKDTTWSCGVRFNDALWRTKECYKRQIYVGDEHLRLQEQHISELEEENGRLKQRIKRLEEAGARMFPHFSRRDTPHKKAVADQWEEATRQ